MVETLHAPGQPLPVVVVCGAPSPGIEAMADVVVDKGEDVKVRAKALSVIAATVRHNNTAFLQFLHAAGLDIVVLALKDATATREDAQRSAVLLRKGFRLLIPGELVHFTPVVDEGVPGKRGPGLRAIKITGPNGCYLPKKYTEPQLPKLIYPWDLKATEDKKDDDAKEVN